MTDLGRKKGIHISNLCRLGARFGAFIFLAALGGCASLPFPAFDLSPNYQPTEFVVPDSWEGTSDFVKANPSDDAVRPDWWKLYEDPVLNNLVEQALAANPDLQAAAERFIQARNAMMKARSRYFPQLGFGFGGSNNRQSDHTLFRAPGEPDSDTQVLGTGFLVETPECGASQNLSCGRTRSRLWACTPYPAGGSDIELFHAAWTGCANRDLQTVDRSL
jgi:hypothetical protein